jgi:hypothetical protein
MTQKEGISVKFSDGMGIFDHHFGYPEIDYKEKYNGPTGKVKDIQGIQAHAGRNFLVPEGKEFSFDISECPYLHIAIKAEEGTKTCLLLCVRDKVPREHVWRPVVMGKTPEGDPGIYDVIKDCFEIKDDSQWHEYDFDLRKIREKQDDEYPSYPDAGSVFIIQFYSWSGSGEQTFHFNDLSLKDKVPFKVDEIEQAKMQRLGKISGFNDARIASLMAKGHTISTLTDKALQDIVTANDLKDSEARELGLTLNLYNLFDGNLDLTETIMKGGLLQPGGRQLDNLRDLAAFDATDWLNILSKANIKLPDDKTIENYAEALSKKVAVLYPTDAFFGRLSPVNVADLTDGIKCVTPLFDGNDKVFSIPGLERINANIAESPETEGLNSIFKRFFPLDNQEPLLKNRSSLQKEFALAYGTSIFDRLNTEQMEQSEIEAIHTRYAQLKRFVNQYPGLGLGIILDDPKLPPADKIAKITERIGLLNRVWEQNPDVEVLKLDYSPNSADMTALNLKDYSALEQAMVLSTLKAYQRAFILTGDVGYARTILESGYISSTGIVNGGFETFVQSTGFSPEVARTHFDAARNMTVTVGAGLGTILDYIWGGFNWLNVSNIKQSSTKTLESGTLNRLDDFETLFGNQTYCQCQHCQSILSPAAYFVDLMHFLDTNLPAAMEQLQIRRPDLWSVELTCDNTNTKIPTLEVVNEILERYIFNIFRPKEIMYVLTDASFQALRDSGVPETVLQLLENLKDQKFYIKPVFIMIVERQLGADCAAYIDRIRDAASTTVNIIFSVMVVFQVINEISRVICSFQRPFVLQIEKLQSYLALFDLTRAKVAREIGADPDVLARTTLNLSLEEYALITQANPDQTFLEDLYNIAFIFEPGSSDKISPFDVQEILKPMSLSRSDMGELIKTRFVSGGIQIIAEKRDTNSVQNDIEKIYNLTLEVLDRMHRFTRLWRRLPPKADAPDTPRWTMTELDLVLYLLGCGSLPRNIDIENIVTVLSLQERWGTSVAETCGIWCDDLNDISFTGQKDSTSLLDQLFNLPAFNQANSPFPRDNSLFVHPAFMQAGNSSSTDDALHRLHAGLRVNDEELYQLIVHLKKAGMNLTATPPVNGFYLTAQNITLLYRHARLAKLLNLSIPALFQLIEFSIPNGLIDHANTPDANLKNLADIATVLEFYDWWQASGYTLNDLGFVTRGTVYNPEAYPDANKLVQQMVENVQVDKAFDFADTVFAFLERVTEEQSRKIITANSDPNANLIEAVNPEKTIYRLASTFTSSTTLTIPSDVTSAVAQAKNMTDLNSVETMLQTETRAALLKYHASEVIPIRLATLVNLSVDKLRSVFPGDIFDSALTQILRGDTIPADPLVQLVDKVLRLSTLFSNQVFDPNTLNFIQFIYVRRDIFSISSLTNVSPAQVRKLSVYTTLADRAAGDGSSSVKWSEGKSAEVSHILSGLATGLPTLSSSERDTLAQALADILQVEIGLAAALLNNVPLPKTAPEALQRLARCATLVTRMGVGGETLPLIISDDCDKLDLACDALLGALRAKHPDEVDWLALVNPIEDKLRSRKRDILCDFLMQLSRLGAFGQHELKTMHDLYQYFLIDVELEGYASTSRVVAAISSVQLYIQRILMNMESVNQNPEMAPKMAQEWEWRKNYRVWEANRKVFLYPENYIEPDLRDDKTPLFQYLESKLLQQQINQQNVLDAYSSYMNGFEEVARLKIAGSFHDIGSDEDTLHLFGVTSDNPPVYYYLAVNNAYWAEIPETNCGIDWSYWRKVDVQIPVRKVAPVVYLGRLFVFWIEITTTPKNDVSAGASSFVGYKHKMTMKYTTLRLDGTWTAPQEISLKYPDVFPTGDGIIEDPLLNPLAVSTINALIVSFISASKGLEKNPNSPVYLSIFQKSMKDLIDKKKEFCIPRYDDKSHLGYPRLLVKKAGESYLDYADRMAQLKPEPKDGYTLTGFQWDQVYPSIIRDDLILTGRNFLLRGAIDFYKKAIIVPAKNGMPITSKMMVPSLRPGNICYAPTSWPFDGYASCSIFSRWENITSVRAFPDQNIIIDSYDEYIDIAGLDVPAELAVINGSLQDCIIDVSGDLFLLQGSCMHSPNACLSVWGPQ